SIDANPDMMKAYRRARHLEPFWRFCFPTAVDFDPKTDRIILAGSQRNRLPIYLKGRDYVGFLADLYDLSLVVASEAKVEGGPIVSRCSGAHRFGLGRPLHRAQRSRQRV